MRSKNRADQVIEAAGKVLGITTGKIASVSSNGASYEVVVVLSMEEMKAITDLIAGAQVPDNQPQGY